MRNFSKRPFAKTNPKKLTSRKYLAFFLIVPFLSS